MKKVKIVVLLFGIILLWFGVWMVVGESENTEGGTPGKNQFVDPPQPKPESKPAPAPNDK